MSLSSVKSSLSLETFHSATNVLSQHRLRREDHERTMRGPSYRGYDYFTQTRDSDGHIPRGARSTARCSRSGAQDNAIHRLFEPQKELCSLLLTKEALILQSAKQGHIIVEKVRVAVIILTFLPCVPDHLRHLKQLCRQRFVDALFIHALLIPALEGEDRLIDEMKLPPFREWSLLLIFEAIEHVFEPSCFAPLFALVRRLVALIPLTVVVQHDPGKPSGQTVPGYAV
mmetsp:Transcript_1761/g.4100  ORF Transcript_1761/g.4100 Transcript_1761/m.4100 type:complete len:228 (+) Transcript_1761:11-694(+)